MSLPADHEPVWVNSLLATPPLTVHDYADFARRKPSPRPGVDHVTVTRCGLLEIEVSYEQDGGREWGVFLRAGQARLLGAHFCKLCWP